MKNKVLIIFKYPHGWNIPVINKFSNYYGTEFLYISNLKNKNFNEVIEEINNLIKSKNIDIVVFDVDYFKFINLFFIQRINAKKKILWTGDDFELHSMNAITASGCDLIISTCPLSVLKYKEKGYEAYITHGEDGKIRTNKKLKKEIDVLFFGALTPDRKEFLEYIGKEGINIKNVAHDEGVSGLSENELKKLISKSKIVLNLSKTRTTSLSNFSSEKVYKFYYQTKGRIIMAGMNGAACVSEYSPMQELLYNNEEIPTFYTKEECVKILKKLIQNDELLKELTNKFTAKTEQLFEDKKSFKSIFDAIEKDDNRKVKIIKVPYWYLRIAAKQIILRNIKISNFFKIMPQLKIIFKIIEDSNFFVKLLILFESILSTLWYSFVLTIKPKN